MKKFKEGDKVRLSNTFQTGEIINNECNGWYSVKFKNGNVNRLPANEIKLPFFDKLRRLDALCDSVVIRYIKLKLWWLKPLVNLIVLISLIFILVTIVSFVAYVIH